MSAEHLKEFLALPDEYQDFYPYAPAGVSVEDFVKMVDRTKEFIEALTGELSLDNVDHREIIIQALTETYLSNS